MKLNNFDSFYDLCLFKLHDEYANNVLWLFKALEKLKRQLAEAEAAVEARKKPPPEIGPRVIGEGLVIDEWVRIS